MRKIYIGLIGLLLVVCAAGAALLQWSAVFEEYEQCDAAVLDAAFLTGMLSDEQLERERNLARWYNFTLREKSPDTGQQSAYDQLLDFGEGKMGYLEIPGQGLFLPIYHEIQWSQESCAVHSFGTSLPVGGRGNCPVLRCSEEGISLSEGDVFCIHILDMVLAYQVAETGSAPPQNPEREDLCVLQLSAEAGAVYVTGVRMENAPDSWEADK